MTTTTTNTRRGGIAAAPTVMAQTIPGRMVQLEGLDMLRELAA